MVNNILVGGLGENQAVEYLINKKYKILETNYKCKLGEIDIICFDKKTKTYVFVEVKARGTAKFGMPREAVNSYKQNKIKMVATSYAQSNRLLEQKLRFDVIEILDGNLTHIINAF